MGQRSNSMTMKISIHSLYSISNTLNYINLWNFKSMSLMNLNFYYMLSDEQLLHIILIVFINILHWSHFIKFLLVLLNYRYRLYRSTFNESILFSFVFWNFWFFGIFFLSFISWSDWRIKKYSPCLLYNNCYSYKQFSLIFYVSCN